MLGLFERIGAGLEMAGLAVEGVVINAKCVASNLAADVKIARAQRSSGGVYDEEDINDTEEFDGEETVSAEQAQAYEKMFAEIVQHEEFCTRKPSEIAIELGYSVEDTKECFEYVQQKMEAEKNMSNDFRKNAFIGGGSGLGKGLSMIIGETFEK